MSAPINLPGSKRSKHRINIPIWAQLSAAFVLIIVLGMMAINAGYSSEWDEEDSNFYGIAMQALKMRNINPSAPTAIIFWEKDCEPCKKAMRGFQGVSSSLRLYGIHLSETQSELDIRQSWLAHAPASAALVIDEDHLLETAFHVRGVPIIFLILPKQKKIFSYIGDVSRKKDRMMELINSEY